MVSVSSGPTQEQARREALDAQCRQLQESLNQAVAKCIQTHNMGRKMSERLAVMESEAEADARAETHGQGGLEAELASAERDLKETHGASSILIVLHPSSL